MRDALKGSKPEQWRPCPEVYVYSAKTAVTNFSSTNLTFYHYFLHNYTLYTYCVHIYLLDLREYYLSTYF